MRKSILITGASRGIGRAAALAFAREGYLVGINYLRSMEAAQSLLQEIVALGGDARLLQADVADPAQVQAMVQAFGRVDVLINNAGIACYKLFTDTTPADWRCVFAVNVEGAYNCSHAVCPQMIGRQAGCILNLSSIWGQTGGACEVAYSASKAAIIGFTKALAKELGPSNIRVNCVAPGVIETDMNANLSPADLAALAAETPLCRIGKPEEVAASLLFLASDAASFITGQILGVNGGFVS